MFFHAENNSLRGAPYTMAEKVYFDEESGRSIFERGSRACLGSKRRRLGRGREAGLQSLMSSPIGLA